MLGKIEVEENDAINGQCYVSFEEMRERHNRVFDTAVPYSSIMRRAALCYIQTVKQNNNNKYNSSLNHVLQFYDICVSILRRQCTDEELLITKDNIYSRFDAIFDNKICDGNDRGLLTHAEQLAENTMLMVRLNGFKSRSEIESVQTIGIGELVGYTAQNKWVK